MFETSEQTDKLDAALCKARALFKPVLKQKDNPYFKSKYADLASVIEAASAALEEHGISITQWPLDSVAGTMCLLTRLALNGQWMRATFSMPVAKQDPQGYVSAITYARRATLQAALNLAAEDDDGEGAVKRDPKQVLKEYVEDTQKYYTEPRTVPIVESKSQKPSIMDLAKFTIDFGEHTGQQLQNFTDPQKLYDLLNKSNEWSKKNKSHKDYYKVIEFIDAATRYLNYSAVSKSADFNDPKKELPNAYKDTDKTL